VTLFEWLKWIHVLAAIVWLGGALITQLYVLRLKTAEPAHRLGFARDLLFAGQWVYVPAATVSLVFGVWMVLDRSAFTFEQTWIIIGLAAAAGIATGFIIPQTRRAIAFMEAGQGPQAGATIKKVGIAARLGTVILLVVLWDMVFKPGLHAMDSILLPTLLTIHLLAVMTWLGGGFLSAVFLRRARKADHAHLAGFLSDIEKIGAAFGIASAIAAAAGIWMVSIWPGYDFSQPWVLIGITGLVISATVGGAYLSPIERKAVAMVKNGEDVTSLLDRVGRILIFDHVLLTIVVWAMVFRPGAP
jgi:uncharacterized membrane protein